MENGEEIIRFVLGCVVFASTCFAIFVLLIELISYAM